MLFSGFFRVSGSSQSSNDPAVMPNLAFKITKRAVFCLMKCNGTIERQPSVYAQHPHWCIKCFHGLIVTINHLINRRSL